MSTQEPITFIDNNDMTDINSSVQASNSVRISATRPTVLEQVNSEYSITSEVNILPPTVSRTEPSNEDEPLPLPMLTETIDDDKVPPYPSLPSISSEMSESNSPLPEPKFVITFKNISYTFNTPPLTKVGQRLLGKQPLKSKTVLNKVSGSIESGRLTALLGPSGSGKSILLDCLARKRVTNVKGSIRISSFNKKLHQIKMAYIPQVTNVFDVLTVRESILFSSKLQNATISSRILKQTGSDHDDPDFHVNLTNKIINQLGLDVCADRRVSACSGGQQKRLSIGIDLVASPDFLICDEPTSGLDSAACESLVELLLSIARNTSTAVLISIHQPPWHVFTMFDKVIMLTKRGGHCMYEGPPRHVPMILNKYDIERSDDASPAEQLIEVACGWSGQDILTTMVNDQKQQFEFDSKSNQLFENRALANQICNPNFPFISHMKTLCLRAMLISIRDPLMIILRIALHIGSAILMFLLYDDIGKNDGCPPKVPAMFDNFHDIYELNERQFIQVTNTYDNMALIYFSSTIILVAALLPNMTSQVHTLAVFHKENFNKWYSVQSFFVAQCLADIPLLASLPIVYVLIHYFANDEPTDEAWRPIAYAAGQLLNAFISEAMGLMIALLFVESAEASMYAQVIAVALPISISGFTVWVKNMPDTWMTLSFLIPFRWVTELLMIVVYGFDRCGHHATQTVMIGMESVSNWLARLVGLNRTLNFDLNFSIGLQDIHVMGVNDVGQLQSAPSPGMTLAQLSINMGSSVFGAFVADKDHQLATRNMVDNGLEDDDLPKCIVYILLLITLYRLVTYLLLARRAYAVG